MDMTLRQRFEKETNAKWLNTQGEPDIDYVEWLEIKVYKQEANPVEPIVTPEACEKKQYVIMEGIAEFERTKIAHDYELVTGYTQGTTEVTSLQYLEEQLIRRNGKNIKVIIEEID